VVAVRVAVAGGVSVEIGGAVGVAVGVSFAFGSTVAVPVAVPLGVAVSVGGFVAVAVAVSVGTLVGVVDGVADSGLVAVGVAVPVLVPVGVNPRHSPPTQLVPSGQSAGVTTQFPSKQFGQVISRPPLLQVHAPQSLSSRQTGVAVAVTVGCGVFVGVKATHTCCRQRAPEQSASEQQPPNGKQTPLQAIRPVGQHSSSP
jgi:hypothetical protein